MVTITTETVVDMAAQEEIVMVNTTITIEIKIFTKQKLCIEDLNQKQNEKKNKKYCIPNFKNIFYPRFS